MQYRESFMFAHDNRHDIRARTPSCSEIMYSTGGAIEHRDIDRSFDAIENGPGVWSNASFFLGENDVFLFLRLHK